MDPTPLSGAEIDPNRIKNFRTRRLDLDCIYGAGPGDQPYLYEHDGVRMTGRLIVGQVDNTGFKDLQRNAEGRAIIGDMRNDENAIVAQIQLAFIVAHNRLVNEAEAQGVKSGAERFERARRSLICYISG